MEQIILSAITWHIEDIQVIRPHQHGLCLTNLITFYDPMTHLVDEEKTVDAVYLEFIKAFDTISHSIMLEELAAQCLDACTLCWVKKWLVGQAQKVVMKGVKSSWQPVMSDVLRVQCWSQSCLITSSMIWMRGSSAA